MTGNMEFSTNLQPYSLESVTFGDGGKRTILGSGSLKVSGMTKLENVLLVNGLKVNLISISQLCDDILLVHLTKGSCLVINSSNSCVIKGKGSSDNCYMMTFSGTCCTTLVNSLDVWHRRLDHISPRSLNETIASDAVMGILKMKVDPGNKCGPCQLGKQGRSTHKVTQHLFTTRTLELLHRDFIRPMQVKSLG